MTKAKSCSKKVIHVDVYVCLEGCISDRLKNIEPFLQRTSLAWKGKEYKKTLKNVKITVWHPQRWHIRNPKMTELKKSQITVDSNKSICVICVVCYGWLMYVFFLCACIGYDCDRCSFPLSLIFKCTKISLSFIP